jgi:hypothetical protein
MKKLITICLLVSIAFTAKGQDLIHFETEDGIGFKNSNGDIVVDAEYEYPKDFPDGLLTLNIDQKYGCVDINGKIKVPFVYHEITDFYKGFAVFRLDRALRIIDKTGKEIKELKYTGLGWFKEDVVNVVLNGKFGRIYNSTGEEIIPPIYDAMVRFGKKFETRVKLNNKWGMIDKVGNIILPIKYDEILPFGKDKYTVQIDKKYGLANISRSELPKVKYDFIDDFYDRETAMVKIDNKFGFIDTFGKEITPVTYDFTRLFYEGYATVKKGGNWFFVNEKGEESSVMFSAFEKYDGVGSFHDGLCVVAFQNKFGFINTKMQKVIPLNYDGVSNFFEGHALVKINNKCGAIDTLGNVIISIDYEEIKELGSGNIKAIKIGKEFYFDKTGKEIEKPIDTK